MRSSVQPRRNIVAKHKSHRGIEKWRKARDLRRKGAVASSEPERKNVTPLTEAEKARYSECVIGFAVCPFCKNRIQVVNDDGRKGESFWDYFANHKEEEGSNASLCEGSERRLCDVGITR